MAPKIFTNINHRSLAARLIGLGFLITFMLAVYSYSSLATYKFTLPDFFASTCSPEAWSDGSWEYKPHTNLTAMADKDDALAFAGWEGCASTREFYWHLASDTPSEWNRWPSVSSYVWEPSKACEVRPMDGAAMVKDLVEQGGWMLMGDSVTENHFFSLSCILYPHVRATPNYTENPYFDRAWPQHLYLDPESPLVSSINFPANFSIQETPLVSFRRNDVLLEKGELETMYEDLYHPDNKTLFSKESFWSISPKEYMSLFTAPLPQGNYATLIASTGGHWTTTLMSGFLDETKKDHGSGIDGVLGFFNITMKKWAEDVQTALHADQQSGVRGKQSARKVVVRAYLPGHDNCHNIDTPWTFWHKPKWTWYNWNYIKDFNKLFQKILAPPMFPDIFFLPIDQPALMRPDAHASGDCLHFMTGTGVMEGWSHYIWHFVTWELPGRIR